MLGETEMMIPDTMRRLGKGVDDLRAFIAANAADSAISGSQPLADAKALIAAADAANGGDEALEDEAPI